MQSRESVMSEYTLAHDVEKGYADFANRLVGERIEIPVHFDLWMRGARFGRVTKHSVKNRCVYVKMDHSQVRRLVKLWYADMEYANVV
jgi:hypothetical protein